MPKPKVYVTRRIREEGLDLLKKECEVTQWDSDEAVPQDELLKNVPGIDVLFCLLTDNVNEEVIAKAGPQLKAICTMSVGYEHIDIEACKKRNIKVGNTPGISTDAVAEMGVALLLATSRRVLEGAEMVKNGGWGTWKPMWLTGPGLLNSTVGMVGLGRIGFAVAERLKPFGVKKILYHDVVESPHASKLPAQFVPLDTLLKEAGFVILCCNLSPQTANLFSKNVYEKMNPNAILVNISRGGVVNQDDLYDALKSGQILGAGLDVTVPEPLPTNHKLLTLKNCVILPHIASAVVETRVGMAILAANNVLAALHDREMPGKVNF